MDKEKAESIIRILYPRRCPICHGVIRIPKALVHPECEKSVPVIGEPRCKKCGKELESGQREYCTDCTDQKHSYTRGVAVYGYRGAIKQSVQKFKFQNKREYADFYVRQMCKSLEAFIHVWQPQALIPVPLHKSRKKKRGFHQAQLLAEGIGEAFGIPVLPDLVVRVVATRPQRQLNKKKRKNNLKNAFKIPAHDVKLKRVLVIDDIYTTGSTINAVSELLTEKGVDRIYFATLCIGNTW